MPGARSIRRIFLWLCQACRIRFYAALSDCRQVSGKPRVRQATLLKGAGRIAFDENVTIGYWPSPYYLSGCVYLESRNPSAAILIGRDTVINNQCVIMAEHKTIAIGRAVLVGTGVEIIDSDFHGLCPEERRRSPHQEAADVSIGDNCFLGSNSKILKGVTIGENSIIGNSSVVTHDIPANAVAAGNPAQVVRSLR